MYILYLLLDIFDMFLMLMMDLVDSGSCELDTRHMPCCNWRYFQ